MEDDRRNNENHLKTTEPLITIPNPRAMHQHMQNNSHNNNNINYSYNSLNSTIPMATNNVPGQSKYAQLLGVIEDLGRDIRPSYAGSRSSAERIKRGIVHARILVRECLVETEKSGRQ